ncbi:MAG: hypothetical protein H7A24_11060 [Leptospiraceae bacterium]|nr:hypothetical protein [Leptospiraceae bacterium]MCP5512412.1 hypothetical protein [Leptospiraceae bacterium]
MEKTGSIYIQINSSESEKNRLANVNIRGILESMRKLEKNVFSDSPAYFPSLGFRIENNSVRHRYITILPFVRLFQDDLSLIEKSGSLRDLPEERKLIIESILLKAKKDKFSFTLSTSLEDSKFLQIEPDTLFNSGENRGDKVKEFTFTGKIIRFDAYESPSLHIHLSEEDTIIPIEVTEEWILELKSNILLKTCTLHVKEKNLALPSHPKYELIHFLESTD